MRCKCCNRPLLSLRWNRMLGDWDDCSVCIAIRRQFKVEKESDKGDFFDRLTDGLYYEWGETLDRPDFKVYKE